MATAQPFIFMMFGTQPTPELQTLSDAGHTLLYCERIVFKCTNGVEAEAHVDQIAGPNAWRLVPDQHKWIPLMVKEMRALQPKPKKGKKSGTSAD